MLHSTPHISESIPFLFSVCTKDRFAAAVRWTNNHLLAALTPPAQKFVSNSEIRFLRTTTVHQSISSSLQASPSARSFASSFAASAGRGRWRGHRSRFSTTSDSGGPPWSLCTGRRERRRSHTNSLNMIGQKMIFLIRTERD